MVDPDPLFACAGEMAHRMAGHAWSQTALGPPGTWSQGLRTSVSIMLRTRHPMLLSWGEDLVMLYNDAFIPTLGTKHPSALGARLESTFAEVWDAVGPMQRAVLAGGAATWDEDLPLTIERGTGPEETFFTFSYSHVPDTPGPGGVLAVLSITTDKVVTARRLALLNELAGVANRGLEPDEALSAAVDVLASADHELLGGALYRDDPGSVDTLVRVRRFGGSGECALPEVAGPGADVALRARLAHRPVTDHHTCEPGDGSEPGRPLLRVALPLRGGSEEDSMVLVLLPHPLRPYDESHRRFARLLADQVGQILALATQRARDQARVEALAALDAAKTAFLSNVSHEFRTPLTLILGPLEDVLSGASDSLAPQDLEAMHRSAHRLLRLVNALLDVARIEATGVEPHLEVVDLAELTRDLLQPFDSAARRAGLAWRAHLDPALGRALVDPALWETILLNLVANALKFTHAGAVDLDLAWSGEQVVLCVSDTGVGIPSDQVGRVFERFHRVAPGRSPGRSIEGAGIGLALVAEAARALGGTVAATSELGTGSRFEVAVPLLPVAGDDPVTSAPSSGAGQAWATDLQLLHEDRDDAPAGDLGLPPGSAHGGPQILVVEDNAEVRARLTRLLAELGTVLTARDGVRALEVLRAGPVDLVVTDVMMPVLDGLGLLEEIRKDESLRGTPVIVLSARAGPEAATGAIEAGADDYVVKPFTSLELLARCRTSLELADHRAGEAARRGRSTLLAGVSHDMQTPLAVISSTLELLADGELPGDDVHRMARRAQVRATQLTGLVTQFLDWSRLSMNEPLPVLLERTDLAALLEEVVTQYDGAARAGDLAGLHERPVWCDPRRTRQILTNLVDNAARVAHSVALDVEDRHEEVLVRVVDDGPGVSPERRARLFEAFGPSSASAGNGLGLHISREAARAQGGDLTLESTGARGTVFVLRLTREQDPS